MVAENKRIKIGTWVQINSADIVECIAISGFDFAIYDMEHGNIDFWPWKRSCELERVRD